jgi:glucose/arabinose dehydrogenase
VKRLAFVLLLAACHRDKLPAPSPPLPPDQLATGQAALGDWMSDSPGVRRKITTADLPPPFATKSADNSAHIVDRPTGALPKVSAGYAVDLYVSGLTNPRMIRTAPNGDLFVAESEANQVRVIHDGKASVFASGFHQPFGIAFYPNERPSFVYIANTDSIVRIPYKDGDLVASAKPEMVYDGVSAGGRLKGGGHWTRDIVFSKDNQRLFLSVGSRSNVDEGDDPEERRRACVFVMTPDGKNARIFASGIRNPVGLAIHPDTGELWTSVNERDDLGDHLPPDYITSVKENGFYGWPWFYIGPNEDPRQKGKHPELREKVIVPDVLVQSHSASLGLTFNPDRTAIFAAEHGSWNRQRRTGYKVITVPLQNGKATGEYVDFMTGFVTPDGDVWGRPVAVAFGNDGALYVTDDAGDCIWRVRRQ